MAHPCNPPRRRVTRVATLGIALVLLAGPFAFGAAASAPAAKKPLCAGKTEAKAIAAIEETWSQILNGTNGNTLEERFAFIEGSEEPEFNAELNRIGTANAGLLETADVQVNEVTCSGKKTADVLYDLVISGTPSPGLAGPGTAILDGKTWKMTSLTVCNLFALADPLLLEEGPCVDIALEG